MDKSRQKKVENLLKFFLLPIVSSFQFEEILGIPAANLSLRYQLEDCPLPDIQKCKLRLTNF
jgi:hypothetical protein